MNATLSETTASGKPGKKGCGRLVLLLSFCIPMLLLAVGFVLQQVHPFGDRQILVTDFGTNIIRFCGCCMKNSGAAVLFCIPGIPVWGQTFSPFLRIMRQVR